jgi:orotidine-5'-phosphate decarboxylase
MGLQAEINVNSPEQLIVALDTASVEQARALVAKIGDEGTFYKVGMELAYAGGLPLVERLVGEGKKVFLDLKLHDIPHTVERATAQVARLGATFLTVHAYPQTMRAALAGAGGTALKLLGVTVLTSMSDKDLVEAGYAAGIETTVVHRARQAKARGMAGLIISPHELRMVRGAIGPDLLLVTPGIRPQGAAHADQKRVMTPFEAITAGADYIVVGRAIIEAPDPRLAALAILDDIARAIRSRGARQAPLPERSDFIGND